MIDAEGGSKAQRASNRRNRKNRRKNEKAKFLDSCEKEITETARSTGASAEEEMFEICREPMTDAEMDKKKYTKRQQAALDKISREIDVEKAALPSPKTPTSKTFPSLKHKASQPPAIAPKAKKAKSATYDLWEADFNPKVNLPIKEAAEHYLSYTKKKVPNAPRSLRDKPSWLKPVALPAAGASYNPDADDYEEYLVKAASKVKDLPEDDANSKPKVERPTEEELMLELTEGLPIDHRYNDEDSEGEDEHTEEKPVGEETENSKPKRRTKKQRDADKKSKREERIRKREKALAQVGHDVFKAKKINKELSKLEAEQNAEALERRKEKLLKKMTTRQKLGRGDFVDDEDAVLLPDELTGSLRQLKPQGNVLAERMKSMQKRNMLPIGGARSKKKKASLRRKYVEKRKMKDVSKGSRII